jgi:hypothetical protein
MGRQDLVEHEILESDIKTVPEIATELPKEGRAYYAETQPLAQESCYKGKFAWGLDLVSGN